MILRLRFKMLILFLPLILLTVTVSGILGFLEYQAALLQAVNRHLSYKAEQLRDFIYSEWTVVEDLNLANQDNYKRATERSFRSFAFSLLRDETEHVLILDGQGRLVTAIGLQEAESTVPALSERMVIPGAGWFSVSVGGAEVVGVSFAFMPFQWTVALTQSRAVFFSGVENILLIHLWILIGSLVIAAMLTVVHVGNIVKPLEHLSGTLELIAENGDLSRRVEVEVADEIGIVSHRFNTLIGVLERQQKDLVLGAQAERQAKETVSQREEETLSVLGRISDFRDEKTGQHLNRIGAMAELLARLYGLDEEQQILIRNSSPLHDLGKIAVPDAILSKPGPLTQEEHSVMRQHTVVGFELLKSSQSQYLLEGATIALAHHEKWDGTGYPQGLAGEAIPLTARIVAIVDVFDALLSERPYKRAWTNEETFEYLTSQSGQHFDPQLIAVFKSNFSLFLTVRASLD